MEQLSVRLLDLFSKINQDNALITENRNIDLPTREQTLGLSFQPGDKVIDSITGKEVEVIAGNKYVIGTGNYQ